MNVIEIDKKIVPIRFGMNALRLFCKDQNIKLNELSRLGNDIGLDEACSLILCGLKDGARKNKTSIDLTVDDIADALDEDFTILEKAMEIFANSFNTAIKGNKVEEKKKSLKKK